MIEPPETYACRGHAETEDPHRQSHVSARKEDVDVHKLVLALIPTTAPPFRGLGIGLHAVEHHMITDRLPMAHVTARTRLGAPFEMAGVE
jgi:hypothetical protein